MKILEGNSGPAPSRSVCANYYNDNYFILCIHFLDDFSL